MEAKKYYYKERYNRRYYKRNNSKIIVDQGDIFSNVIMKDYKGSVNEIEDNEITWDKVVVLSQSCDLHREQENSEVSNEILSVLVIPIFSLADFQAGTYLKQLNKEKNEIPNSRLARIVLENRYQVLKLTEREKFKFKMDDSILDFRYYFTVPISKLKKENYQFSISTVYINKITQSFTHYISRIAVPIELDRN